MHTSCSILAIMISIWGMASQCKQRCYTTYQLCRWPKEFTGRKVWEDVSEWECITNLSSPSCVLGTVCISIWSAVVYVHKYDRHIEKIYSSWVCMNLENSPHWSHKNATISSCCWAWKICCLWTTLSWGNEEPGNYSFYSTCWVSEWKLYNTLSSWKV